MPGSTTQVRAAASVSTSRFRCLLKSMHQRAADRLPRLRGAAPARQQRHALLARDRHRRAHVLVRPRHDHADRLDLVVRRVRRIAPAREAIEQHLALELLAQALGEAMGDRRRLASTCVIAPSSPAARGHGRNSRRRPYCVQRPGCRSSRFRQAPADRYAIAIAPYTGGRPCPTHRAAPAVISCRFPGRRRCRTASCAPWTCR